MKEQKFVIMVGNIATGKTEWLRQYLRREENKPTVCLSKDSMRWCLGGGNKYLWTEQSEYHIHEDVLQQVGNYLVDGVSVIYDETNMNAETRAPFIKVAADIFRECHHICDIEAIVMPQVTVDESMKRRCGKSGEAWGYPEKLWREVWHRKENLYGCPDYSEGFTSIVSVGGF